MHEVLHRQDNGVETIVDSDIAEFLKTHPVFYVVKNKYLGFRLNGKTVYLHRYVMNFPLGKVVDHENGNGHDNRRSNLRVCCVANNIRNRTVLNKNNVSGRRGVDRLGKKWKASIKHNRRNIYIGLFETFSEAVVARESMEVKLWGSFKGKV